MVKSKTNEPDISKYDIFISKSEFRTSYSDLIRPNTLLLRLTDFSSNSAYAVATFQAVGSTEHRNTYWTNSGSTTSSYRKVDTKTKCICSVSNKDLDEGCINIDELTLLQLLSRGYRLNLKEYSQWLA